MAQSDQTDDPAAPRLLIDLLGLFRVSLDGQIVDQFAYDKVRALLAFLAAEADRPHHRDSLAGLLWTVTTDKGARDSLRQALAGLRRTIGDGRADPPFLLVSRESVQLNPAASCRVDAVAFDSLLDAVKRHNHRRPAACPACARRLQQAVDLYRGEFLEKLAPADSPTFEAWAAIRRERVHRQALDAMYTLADYHALHGNWPVVYRLAARQLTLEPWREEAHRQAMLALARDGQRSAALAQFRRCAAVLAEELAVEPGADTVRLYEQILKSEPVRQRPWGQPDLPQTASSFVGRQQELAELSELLSNRDCRLVTIGGPGGAGKTRLAVEVAREMAPCFSDGTAFVPLAAVAGVEGLVAAIAGALEFRFQDGKPEEEQLLAYLKDRELLLVLDNFEHLLDGRLFLADLLDRTGHLVLLVTSRHLLSIQAEWVFDLTGLPYPPDPQTPDASTYDAVQLFAGRAQQVQRRFSLSGENVAAVLQICRLTEGLPLALELAATAINIDEPAAIAGRLATGLTALTGRLIDVADRQRSMTATLAYSWELLTLEEQETLSRLALFRGGFDESAARSVAGADLHSLHALAGKSWLRTTGSGRFEMYELLRQFAAEQRPPAVETQRLHSEYYLSLAAEQAPHFDGGRALAAVAAIRPDIDNLRQAWLFALNSRLWPSIERAAPGLDGYYHFAGLYAEGETAFSLAAGLLADGEEPLLTAGLRLKEARFMQKLGRYGDALTAVEEVLNLLGPAAGSRSPAAGLRLEMLALLGRLHELRGEYGPAIARLEDALFLSGPDPVGPEAARALNQLGSVYWRMSDYPRALATFQRALTANQAAGRESAVAQDLGNLGLVYKDMGDFPRAQTQLQAALTIVEGSGHREYIARYSQNLGLVQWQMGRLEEALGSYQKALQIARELDHRRGISMCLGSIGLVLRAWGRFDEALAMFSEALGLARELGDRSQVAIYTGNIGNVHMVLGAFDQALQYQEAALALDQELGNLEGMARHLGNMGDVYKDRGDFSAALACFDRSLSLFRQVGARYYLCWVLVSRAETLLAAGRPTEAAPLNAEGGQIAREVGRRDTDFLSRVIAGRLLEARGERSAALAALQLLLPTAETADEKAQVHFTLWQIGGDDEQRRAAIEIYQTLWAEVPRALYRRRLDALNGAQPAG